MYCGTSVPGAVTPRLIYYAIYSILLIELTIKCH
jgi:hypothetical protein